MLRLPAVRPAALRCLRLAVPAECLFSLRAAPSTRAASLGPRNSGGPIRIVWTGNNGLSHVPGEPQCAHALFLRPRWHQAARPITAARRGLPYMMRTTSAPTISPLSRLNHTAYALAVYASQRGSLRDHARLASGCRSALPGRTGYLLGSYEGFQACGLWTHFAVLLSQVFRGAPALRASAAHVTGQAVTAQAVPRRPSC
jgi:hypothetical protein